MEEILLIGLGNLGVRHLQGLIRGGAKKIHCIDPNSSTFEVAKKLAKDTGCPQPELSFSTELPKNQKYFTTVVATNSNERLQVIRELLSNNSTQHLILEKVIFPRLDDFDVFNALIKHANINIYVNHPRRLHSVYQMIKLKINKRQPIYMSVSGCEWGLASNALHFIDLMTFLCGEVAEKINCSEITQLYDSKRIGYKEATGNMEIQFSQGSKLILSSTLGTFHDLHIQISNGEKYYTILEGSTNRFFSFDVEGSQEISPLYVSETTGWVLKDLLEKGSCLLTPYSESEINHRRIIEAFNSQFQQLEPNSPIPHYIT